VRRLRYLRVTVNVKHIRDESIRTARQFGVDVPVTLPWLEENLKMRSPDETISRILAMTAVAALAYGFDKASCGRPCLWLRQSKLWPPLLMASTKQRASPG
jgi:hypothetical protein